MTVGSISNNSSEETHLRLTIGRIPIVVAVTGHRDIAPASEEQLRLAVRSKLKEIMNMFPDTPFRALSGLAEGADMIFAEAALDMGMELVAVLPVEPETFLLDFDVPAHKDRKPEDLKSRFHELLAKCADTAIVAGSLSAGDSKRYELVGEYLVRHCHMLIALWDGMPTTRQGGTHHVVNMALGVEEGRGQEQHTRKIDAPVPRLIYHLETSRQAMVQASPVWKCYPEDRHEWRSMQEPLEELNHFSADVRMNDAFLSMEISRIVEKITPKSCKLTQHERNTLEVYVATDSLACQLQHKIKLNIRLVYICAICMLFSFGVYTHYTDIPELLAVYLFAFVSLWLIFVYDKRLKIHDSYVNYRGIAEGMRVKFNLMLLGIPIGESNSYSRKHSEEVTLMREAMIGLAAGSLRSKPLGLEVITNWVDDQASYFKRKSNIMASLRVRSEKISTLLYSAGVVATLITLTYALGTKLTYHDSDIFSAAVFLMGHLAVCGALVSGYAHHMGFSQLAKEYSRMHLFYSRVQKVLTFPIGEDPLAIKNIVFEVGREALDENAEWMAMHRERPIDPKQ